MASAHRPPASRHSGPARGHGAPRDAVATACAGLLAPGSVAVARVTEVIASSPDGFREAVEEGLVRAARTLRNITGLEVTGKRVKVDRGRIVEYRVDMKLNFLLED